MAEYDAKTALVVVDMQNDFADPRGALYVRGGEDVLPVANAEIAKARAAGALVVYTQDWHPPSTPHFAKDGGTWPVHCVRGTWGAELHPGLDVAVEGNETSVTLRKVVRTGTGDQDGYSAFEAPAEGRGRPLPLEGQGDGGIGVERNPGEGVGRGAAARSARGGELERLLREHGVERLAVLGLATDYCVRATTLDGLAAGFAATVLAAGVRAVDLQPGDGERALDEMRRAGAVVE